MIEDGASVLRSNIITLAVQGCRIMRFPKHFQQVIETDLCRIKYDLYHFCMTGSTGGNIFVGRVDI